MSTSATSVVIAWTIARIVWYNTEGLYQSRFLRRVIEAGVSF